MPKCANHQISPVLEPQPAQMAKREREDARRRLQTHIGQGLATINQPTNGWPAEGGQSPSSDGIHYMWLYIVALELLQSINASTS